MRTVLIAILAAGGLAGVLAGRHLHRMSKHLKDR